MNSNKRKSGRRMQLVPHAKIRMSMKLIYKVSAFMLLLIAGGLTLFFNVTNSQKAYAFVSGDFRSKASGAWSAASTWERYNGSSWAAAAAAPIIADGNIYIQGGFTVSITSNISADQVVINSGSVLDLNNGKTLSLSSGTGTDLNVSGIFKNAGTVTILPSATIVYQSGGKYQHNFTSTAGVIPTATWSTGSTCEVIGYTSNNSAPTGLQTFYNFTWNCPSQGSDINLSGGLTSVLGNFTVNSTGSKSFTLASGNSSLNVGGDLIISGGNFILSSKDPSLYTCNITGDYTQTAGIFTIVDKNNSIGTINISSDWSHTGGTITVGGNSTTSALIYFRKSGTQTFTSGGTVSGNVDFTINSGSILSMGTNILSGRNFTLSSGGGILIGSLAGITSSGSSGNIQVSGTRSFNTVADYSYNGLAAQTSGNGLPATVRNLTLNNSTGLTLTNTVSVSTLLTLTSGKITTGINELRVTSTSTSSITSYSSSDYVIGNLRRSVSASGSYDFPLGTASNYELINVDLASTTGVSTILGTFTNANPLVPARPLTGINVNWYNIDKLLSYGYWTLTPNSPLLTGTYSVTLNENGTTPNPLFKYFVLKRSSSAASWASIGTQGSQSVSGSTAISTISGVNSFSDFAVGYEELYSMINPVLTSGTAGQVNAIYKISNAKVGLDIWIQIVSIENGASLANIDQFSGGYDLSWQPLVTAAPNDTSSITWKITFKRAGTAVDTTLASFSLSAIDVDGSSSLTEFIEASRITSYAKDASCNLTITNTNTGYKATSPFIGISNIDTSQHQAMYQINYSNINNFTYRTGAINNSGSSDDRQNSIFFKPFFSGSLALPIELLYFKGTLQEGIVNLTWATAAEKNNDYFTIERSSDCKKFEPVLQKDGAGNSTKTLYYGALDQTPLKGDSYYRLKQTDFDGKTSYSNVISIKNGTSANDKSEAAAIEIKSVSPNPFGNSFKLLFTSKEAAQVDFMLMNTSGNIIAREKIEANEGINTFEFVDMKNLKQGVYFATLVYDNNKVTQKVIKN